MVAGTFTDSTRKRNVPIRQPSHALNEDSTAKHSKGHGLSVLAAIAVGVVPPGDIVGQGAFIVLGVACMLPSELVLPLIWTSIAPPPCPTFVDS